MYTDTYVEEIDIYCDTAPRGPYVLEENECSLLHALSKINLLFLRVLKKKQKLDFNCSLERLALLKTRASGACNGKIIVVV